MQSTSFIVSLIIAFAAVSSAFETSHLERRSAGKIAAVTGAAILTGGVAYAVQKKRDEHKYNRLAAQDYTHAYAPKAPLTPAGEAVAVLSRDERERQENRQKWERKMAKEEAKKAGKVVAKDGMTKKTIKEEKKVDKAARKAAKAAAKAEQKEAKKAEKEAKKEQKKYEKEHHH